LKNYFSSNFKLGVLGGGQLGRMLLTETQKFDIYTSVLDSSKEAPCAQICNEFHLGDLLNFDDVYNFGKKVDVLTIEIENVNIDALDKLEAEGLVIYPKPSNLRVIQSKANQKQFYVENTIPTAPFLHFAHLEDLKKSFETGILEFPFVWKAARFGYDGTGVKIVKTFKDLAYLPTGEMEFHPEANQVEYVICPARIDNEIANKAKEIALKVADAFDFVGLLAVEMFLTEDNEILVNEVAPRTHNSGHYSIEASYTNQFEQHVRSILDLPLGNTDSKVAGIMVNLVGEEGFTGDVVYENIDEILKIDGVTPHIYGKKHTKPKKNSSKSKRNY